jgi:hypothetical protein
MSTMKRDSTFDPALVRSIPARSPKTSKARKRNVPGLCVVWRGQDLNLRPSGYEPDELPDCSTPRRSELLSLTRYQEPSTNKLSALKTVN